MNRRRKRRRPKPRVVPAAQPLQPRKRWRRPLLRWTRERVRPVCVVAGAVALVALFQPWQVVRGNPDLSDRPTVSTTGRIVDGCRGAGRKTAACVSWISYPDQRGQPRTVRVVVGWVDDPAAVPMAYDRDRPWIATPTGKADAGVALRSTEVALSLALGGVAGAMLGLCVSALVGRALALRSAEDVFWVEDVRTQQKARGPYPTREEAVAAMHAHLADPAGSGQRLAVVMMRLGRFDGTVRRTGDEAGP